MGSIWLSEAKSFHARSMKVFSDFSVGSGDFFAGLIWSSENVEQRGAEDGLSRLWRRKYHNQEPFSNTLM